MKTKTSIDSKENISENSAQKIIEWIKKNFLTIDSDKILVQPNWKIKQFLTTFSFSIWVDKEYTGTQIHIIIGKLFIHIHTVKYKDEIEITFRLNTLDNQKSLTFLIETI